MYREQKYIFICRYVLLLGGILGTLFKISVSLYPIFILLSLMLVINSQIRISYLKGKPIILSIIIECALIIYICFNFGGFAYLVLFADMIDASMLLKSEAYPLSIYISICIAYTLYSIYSLEWAVTIFIFYIVIFLMLRQFIGELMRRADTEVLYDRIRKYAYELEAAKSRLLDYSKQVEKVVQLEERNRISRELHDSIGHSLTGILMQVDACMHIMPLNNEKGMELLNSVYNNINEGIEIMRKTVKRLKPEQYRNVTEALNELIDKFISDTGVNVELKTYGTYYELLPSIETIIYQNTREAMTNALRHGQAKNITVSLDYQKKYISLTVSNDGAAPSHLKKGFGLCGIEERVKLINGDVSYSFENGFSINMLMPAGEV